MRKTPVNLYLHICALTYMQKYTHVHAYYRGRKRERTVKCRVVGYSRFCHHRKPEKGFLAV